MCIQRLETLIAAINRTNAETLIEGETITALISVDMNGLKTINDNEGHNAGDLALTTLADCFLRAVKSKHRVYRVGGDEFIIVCRKVPEDTVSDICARIHQIVSETRYSCSIGYCYSKGEGRSIDDMLKESDKNMYSEKEQYYKEQKRSTTYKRDGKKIGRNDPCPCGSGKKYKNCCMNKETA